MAAGVHLLDRLHTEDGFTLIELMITIAITRSSFSR